MSDGIPQKDPMDLEHHRRTWLQFVQFTKWSCILIAVTLALMAIFLT